MNDNDLERQLRSQPGPREEGYTPTRLPMSLEEARNRSSGPAPLVRGGLFVGAALAGVLAVAVAAAVLSGPGTNGVGGNTEASQSPTASAPASPAASGPASPGACMPADLHIDAEPWGGAAGSRGTILTVSTPSSSCAIAAEPVAQISDAHGTVLVSSPAPKTGHAVTRPDSGYAVQFAVTWSNWCGAAPDEPLTLSISFGWAAPVPVTVPAGGDNPVPPCSGDGASTLSVTLLGVVQ